MARNQELTAQEVIDICAGYMNEKNTKYVYMMSALQQIQYFFLSFHMKSITPIQNLTVVVEVNSSKGCCAMVDDPHHRALMGQ